MFDEMSENSFQKDNQEKNEEQNNDENLDNNMNQNEFISKKDVLKEMNISYGQLYRWKREGLIPDEWFNKQSVTTGQETYFQKNQIIPRIKTILELKDKYQLDELKTFLTPDLNKRNFTIREVVVIDNINPFILKIYCKNKDSINLRELTIIYIFSTNEEDIKYDKYYDYDFSKIDDSCNIFYILELNNDRYILITSENTIIDKSIKVIKLIRIDVVISMIAKLLKE